MAFRAPAAASLYAGGSPNALKVSPAVLAALQILRRNEGIENTVLVGSCQVSCQALTLQYTQLCLPLNIDLLAEVIVCIHKVKVSHSSLSVNIFSH